MTMNDVKTNHAINLLQLAIEALTEATKLQNEHEGTTTTVAVAMGTVTIDRDTGAVTFTPDE